MKGRAILFLLLPLACATAQHDFESVARRVVVHISLPDGTCDSSAQVTLAAHNGPFVQGSRNAPCEMEFFNVPEGEYRVEISGQDLTTASVNNNINVSASGPMEFDVAVRHRNAVDFSGMGTSAFVSASGLAVPKRAKKELDRSNELIRNGELQQAIAKLKKATEIYPQYALAYNNLGVLYSRLGDRVHENEALQKAISLDPSFALAYVNVGRMDMKGNDYPGAEAAFNKALSFNPTDAITLILLSYSEFMDKSFDAAIATSQKAHSLDKPHAFAHRVAARAFEQEKQGAKAIAELEIFLKEEPSGPRADAARHEIEVVRAALPN